MSNVHTRAAKRAGFNKNSWKAVIAVSVVMLLAVYMVSKFPAIIRVKVKVVEQTATSITYSASGIKIRDCGFIFNSPVGYVKTADSRLYLADFNFVRVPKVSSDPRSFFRTDMKFWQCDWGETPELQGKTVTEVRVISQHVCGDYLIERDDDEVGTQHIKSGDLIFSIYGPFDVPKNQF